MGTSSCDPVVHVATDEFSNQAADDGGEVRASLLIGYISRINQLGQQVAPMLYLRVRP